MLRRTCLPVALAFLPVLLACSKTHSAPPEPSVTAATGAAAPPAGTAAQGTAAPGAAPAGAQDTTPPPGVDLSKLDEFERRVFFRIVNKEPSICGDAHSLIVSAKTPVACRKSWYALKYAARKVDEGFTDSEVSEAIEKRFRQGKAKAIDVSEAPMKGAPGARITIVEFADYECPHCKRVQPVLRQIIDEYRNDVKVYFKNYPLPQHDHAREAAEAAVAAHKQGKFAAFDDKLWANQENLSPADLEKYAKEAGLDVARWRADKDDAAVKARVQKDRAEGGVLGMTATPTIYIDGREYTDPRDFESLKDWIDEELGR